MKLIKNKLLVIVTNDSLSHDKSFDKNESNVDDLIRKVQEYIF